MSNFLWHLRATIYLDNQDEPLYISAAVCTSADNAKTIAEKYAQTPLDWSFDEDDNDPLWEADGRDLPISISYRLFGRVDLWAIWGYKLNEEFVGDWDIVPLAVVPSV